MLCLAPARGVRRFPSIAHRSAKLQHFSASASCNLFPSYPQNSNSYQAQLKDGIDEERLAEREFLFSLLQNSPSKRDAKAYLSRFALPKKVEKREKKGTYATLEPINSARVDVPNFSQLNKIGVNLGSLYTPGKAIEESPVFTQHPLSEAKLPKRNPQTLHLALVKIRKLQALDDHTLSGIGLTLSQLVRLGLNIVVVAECEEDNSDEKIAQVNRTWKEQVHSQLDRIITAISEHNRPGVIMVQDALQCLEAGEEFLSNIPVKVRVGVQRRELILPLLETGVVVVLPPIASSPDMTRLQRVSPDDIVLALTREFAGLHGHIPESIRQQQSDGGGKSQLTSTISENVSLDRIIVLDPLGGIPSKERSDNAHIFINLQQEYESIISELSQTGGAGNGLAKEVSPESHPSMLGGSNPISTFVEQEVIPLHSSQESPTIVKSASSPHNTQHRRNLDLVNSALALLPPASSALITTPSSAAISSQQPHTVTATTAGVRTRLTKNPLIHNLLTDKPMVSSSLPISRFTAPPENQQDRPKNSLYSSHHPTFLKRGIPLTIIPDPRVQPWLPPGPEGTSLSLRDPRIDFSRLLYLIEDSFGRKLDVAHYLDRIENRLAGVIIAGNYEGGAICTWETPSRGLGHSVTNPTPIPYLDKFAVLRASQGTGGVADIVFKALLRTCFPKGCIWRSRTSNPVNKWYTERSNGTWKIPGGAWTMFWTTEGGFSGNRGEIDRERWRDYEHVCRNIAPSWADDKAPD